MLTMYRKAQRDCAVLSKEQLISDPCTHDQDLELLLNTGLAPIHSHPWAQGGNTPNSPSLTIKPICVLMTNSAVAGIVSSRTDYTWHL